MSRTYYPSDEYDSSELEEERAKLYRRRLRRFRRDDDDDDDDPPTAPIAARLPKSPPFGAAQAA